MTRNATSLCYKERRFVQTQHLGGIIKTTKFSLLVVNDECGNLVWIEQGVLQLGKNAPLLMIFSSQSQFILLCYELHLVEDTRFWLGFKDQFKENDESVQGVYEWSKWHVQLCFGFSKFLRVTIKSSMFGREHLHCCESFGGKMGFLGCMRVSWENFVVLSNSFLFLCPTSKGEGSSWYMSVQCWETFYHI